jgi:hypothetical protein
VRRSIFKNNLRAEVLAEVVDVDHAMVYDMQIYFGQYTKSARETQRGGC